MRTLRRSIQTPAAAKPIPTCALFYGYEPRLCSRWQGSTRSAERGMSYRQRISSCVQTLQTSRVTIQNPDDPIQSPKHPIQNATALADNAVVGHMHSFPGWKKASEAEVRNGAIPRSCWHQTPTASRRPAAAQVSIPGQAVSGNGVAAEVARLPRRSSICTAARDVRSSVTVFTGVRFVPCEGYLQTRSDDGTANRGRGVARSGGQRDDEDSKDHPPQGCGCLPAPVSGATDRAASTRGPLHHSKSKVDDRHLLTIGLTAQREACNLKWKLVPYRRT